MNAPGSMRATSPTRPKTTATTSHTRAAPSIEPAVAARATSSPVAAGLVIAMVSPRSVATAHQFAAATTTKTMTSQITAPFEQTRVRRPRTRRTP